MYDDLFEEVRGLGVLIGMQFRNSDIGYAVSQGLFGRGVLIGGTLFNSLTLRIQPPAIITYEQMDRCSSASRRRSPTCASSPQQGELVAH